MIDFFDLFGEPRRPWLDTNALKQKFLSLSLNFHPDKIHSANESEKIAAAKQIAELNAAYKCLAEPKSRLLHLLELEMGAKPKEIQQIPNELANLFAEVAVICKKADVFLAEKEKNNSPLLHAQLFAQSQDCFEQLDSSQKKIGALRQDLNNELKALDDRWMKTDAVHQRDIVPELEKNYRLCSYFNRWNSQIHERILRLAL